MKIGAVLNPYRLPLEQVEECSEMDLDFIEIIADGTKTGPEVLKRRSEEIRGAAERYSLDIYMHLPWNLDIGNPYEESRKGAVRTLERILKMGKALEAKKATVHPDSRSHDYWNANEIEDNVIESLLDLEKSTGKFGVELVAENVRAFGLDNFHRIFKETDIDMCLDTGHAYIGGSDEEDILNFLRKNMERVTHIHLNDNRGKYDEHLSLGYGFIDLERILEGLRRMEWESSLSMELFTRNPEYLEMSRKKVKEWLED